MERSKVAQILYEYGLGPGEAQPVVEALALQQDQWVPFMMRFELGRTKPDPRRGLSSALTIGLSYVLGGLFPLAPTS